MSKVVEFIQDVYELTEEDLTTYKFPYSKLLQSKYDDPNKVWSLFKKEVDEYLAKTSGEDLDLKKIKQDILEIRDKLKETYPVSFNEYGWWDLKVYKEAIEPEWSKELSRKIKEITQQKVELESDYKANLWALDKEIQKIEDSRTRTVILNTMRELGFKEFYHRDLPQELKKIPATVLVKLGISCELRNGRNIYFVEENLDE